MSALEWLVRNFVVVLRNMPIWLWRYFPVRLQRRGSLKNTWRGHEVNVKSDGSDDPFNIILGLRYRRNGKLVDRMLPFARSEVTDIVMVIAGSFLIVISLYFLYFAPYLNALWRIMVFCMTTIMTAALLDTHGNRLIRRVSIVGWFGHLLFVERIGEFPAFAIGASTLVVLILLQPLLNYRSGEIGYTAVVETRRKTKPFVRAERLTKDRKPRPQAPAQRLQPEATVFSNGHHQKPGPVTTAVRPPLVNKKSAVEQEAPEELFGLVKQLLRLSDRSEAVAAVEELVAGRNVKQGSLNGFLNSLSRIAKQAVDEERPISDLAELLRPKDRRPEPKPSQPEKRTTIFDLIDSVLSLKELADFGRWLGLNSRSDTDKDYAYVARGALKRFFDRRTDIMNVTGAVKAIYVYASQQVDEDVHSIELMSIEELFDECDFQAQPESA